METNTDVHKPQSTLTVLERSRELHLLLCKVTLDDNLLPKVYRLIIGKPVTDHSQLIYESLAVANTLDLYDKDLTEKRKDYQLIARRELTKLLASLRIMYSISGMDSDKMKVLLDKTIEVERLLKKWMESDRTRIGTALNIVKKDVIDTHVLDKQITTSDLFETKTHVDFEALLKDARVQPPSTFVHHETGKPVFIPPADSLPKAPVPEPIYVVKSEEERIEDLKKSRFSLDNLGKKPVEPPKHKDRADLAIPTREPVVITVRDKPIIVPDNRIPPEPPREDAGDKPLAPTVEIVVGATPEIATEDLPKEEAITENKEKEVCPTTQDVPSTEKEDAPSSDKTTEAVTSSPSSEEVPKTT